MESGSAQRKLLNKLLGIFLFLTLLSVKVFVGAGSRHEDLETSGSAYLLEKMFLRGTSGKSKQDLT